MALASFFLPPLPPLCNCNVQLLELEMTTVHSVWGCVAAVAAGGDASESRVNDDGDPVAAPKKEEAEAVWALLVDEEDGSSELKRPFKFRLV